MFVSILYFALKLQLVRIVITIITFILKVSMVGIYNNNMYNGYLLCIQKKLLQYTMVAYIGNICGECYLGQNKKFK